MQDWTAGYVAEIGYTHGYYHELNPLRARFALLLAGLHAPPAATACELGFGQGVSVNLHAAAAPIEWHGTDFNPSQAAHAAEIARACGSGAHLQAEAFAEFARRSDLPDFDAIGLHGIWSWISAANRAVIVDFIERKLKVGGVLYISYNTLPGWAAFAPLRHVMTEHATRVGAEGEGIVGRIDRAIRFTESLLAVNPVFAAQNPTVATRWAHIKGQNRAYLAHEFFNRDWEPMYFSAMADCLREARLDYGCSAHLMDHLDMVNLTPEQQGFLAAIPDPMLREGMRDFVVNQQFRRDYWVKGARRLSPLQQAELLGEQRVVLQVPRDAVSLTIKGLLGEARMSEAVYLPVLDLLADHKARTLRQIERAVGTPEMSFAHLVEAVKVLVAVGTLAVAQDEASGKRARKCAERCNGYPLDLARSGGEIGALASPLTGGGMVLDRFEQLFVLALNQGRKLPAEWADFAWAILAREGRKLVKDGAVIDSPDGNLAALHEQANRFAGQRLPMLRALQVV